MVTLPSSAETREIKEVRRAQEPVVSEESMARQEALDRLVDMLEKYGENTVRRSASHRSDELSQLSRLRAARVTYTLSRMGGMERVSKGAWIRRRSHMAE